MDWIRIGDILMAHFAQIDDDNIVTNVIVIHNNELLDDNGIESELKGIEFCVAHYGGHWVQTSYNATFRGVFAGIGFKYDKTLDEFIAPIEEFSLVNEAELETE
jgi:hypothetical protein